MILETCVVVGLILATPEVTTIYHVRVPLGNVSFRDFPSELASLAATAVGDVEVSKYGKLPSNGAPAPCIPPILYASIRKEAF